MELPRLRCGDGSIPVEIGRGLMPKKDCEAGMRRFPPKEGRESVDDQNAEEQEQESHR